MKNKTIRIGQTTIDFLLEAADINGAVSMFEFWVPTRAKVPLPHPHEHYDEAIYGIEGVITFSVEGKAIDIAPDKTYFMPRGTIHGFNNLRQVGAKALAVITQVLIGPNFFMECAEIVDAGVPPYIEKLKLVMLKHGLVPART